MKKLFNVAEDEEVDEAQETQVVDISETEWKEEREIQNELLFRVVYFTQQT